ncbi:MAG: hypothetical protein AB7U83_08375 [Vicinamibacterales bacterium]
MSAPLIVACLVCGRPLDALLTSGLHAGVLVMVAVALGVVAAIGRGVVGLLREDRRALDGVASSTERGR